ncbi:MAG: DUF1508 domain-containing protein [Planctomycetes bacterium]|nr:DUF1508 domain-containing protein [Planctomycetota bacterium]
MATFQIFKDAADEYRWRLRANNNQIVATSGEGYKAKADCQRGIEIVQNEGPSANVEDQT